MVGYILESIRSTACIILGKQTVYIGALSSTPSDLLKKNIAEVTGKKLKFVLKKPWELIKQDKELFMPPCFEVLYLNDDLCVPKSVMWE